MPGRHQFGGSRTPREMKIYVLSQYKYTRDELEAVGPDGSIIFVY